jgi:ABC-2 type transport system permease protein
MRPAVVSTIVGKDLREFRADRFFLLITGLSLVFYPLLFWLLPSTVDETLRVGVVQRGLDPVVAAVSEGSEGLEVLELSDQAELEDALLTGDTDLVAGLVFPDDLLADVAAGEPNQVTLLITADVPPEVETALAALANEVALMALGEAPPTDLLAEPVVLGDDQFGDQVSLREQLRPLLAFFVLMTETFALATLVAAEVQTRTVTAVLVTPATRADFLAAKGVVGTGVAFTEAAVIMALIGGFATGAPILVVALLLGAALVTGIGMVAGSFGRDFMTVLFTSILVMIPLMVPAFAALFPGTANVWVQVLPTYGFVQTVVEVTTTGAGWSDVALDLLLLAGWTLAAFVGGWVVLGRKVATL